jgi:hypothetical protein
MPSSVSSRPVSSSHSAHPSAIAMKLDADQINRNEAFAGDVGGAPVPSTAWSRSSDGPPSRRQSSGRITRTSCGQAGGEAADCPSIAAIVEPRQPGVVRRQTRMWRVGSSAMRA